MNYILVIIGILLVVTGSDLLFTHSLPDFMTPLGLIGYDLLKTVSYHHMGEVQITGIFLFIMGLVSVVIGAHGPAGSMKHL
jgi:uncharacterized membrane protein